MTTVWIDFDQYEYESKDAGQIGWVGYLVETDSAGRTSYSLRERPLRTNQSQEPRLYGWCGETNNKSRCALGAWRVVCLNKDSDRAQIVNVEGKDLAAFLESDGYPDLLHKAVAA